MVPENPNEVVTRRREQTLSEQRANYQIQDHRPSQRRIIPTPGLVQPLQIKPDIADKKRRQWVELKEQYVGYVRLQDVTDAPRASDFEPDTEDLDLLQRLFPRDFPQAKPLPANVFDSPICKDFIRILEYIEEKRDFEFKELQLPDTKFGRDSLQKVIEYWRAKTLRTKYTLNRKYWKENNKKMEFGRLHEHRTPYLERQDDKKKTTRSVRKLSNVELWQQINGTDKHIEIIEMIEKLAVRREILKMSSVLSRNGIQDKSVNPKEVVKGADAEIKEGEGMYAKLVPPERVQSIPALREVVPPAVVGPAAAAEAVPVPRGQKVPENEIAFLVSTVLSQLEIFKFNINDIRVQNLQEINSHIWNLRQTYAQAAMVSPQDKVINLSARHLRPTYPSYDRYVPVKRFSYRCSLDTYIEKMDVNKLRHEMEGPHGRNYVQDFQLREDFAFQRLGMDHSHFMFNARTGLNPDIYCDATNSSTSNVRLLNYRNSRNAKLCQDLSIGEDSWSDAGDEFPGPRASVQQQAEKEMSTLNLRMGFQNWKNSKRIKTG
jgi:hypothetical protein